MLAGFSVSFKDFSGFEQSVEHQGMLSISVS
jgi:hypothetical protein